MTAAMVNVRLYGRLGDLLGEEVRLELAGGACSIGHLRAALAERYPAARADILGPRVRACVGDTIVGEDQLVQAGDTVELLPPVSGG